MSQYQNKRMTKDERRLIEFLPKGSERPRPLKELSKLLYGDAERKNTRKTRRIINSLVINYEIPVGSKHSRPNGYFLITNEAERQTALKTLDAQSADLINRAAHLQKASVWR